MKYSDTNSFWLFRLSWAFILFVTSAVAAQAPATQEEIDRLVRTTASYQSGLSMESLRRLEALARQSLSDATLRQRVESGLVQLLGDGSTVEARQFASQQLATIGTEASLSALADLLENAATAELASQVLSTHPSPKASDVLRQALPKLTGSALVQVVGTLGDRQDSASVERLAALVRDPDHAVAAAAILALGKIANAPAREVIAGFRRTLTRPPGTLARPRSEGEVRAVYEASMVAAERLVAVGERAEATGIYQELIDPAHPDNVRRGAFEALLPLDDDGGEQRILETLRGTDALLKPVAIAGMRPLRSPAASEKFAAALPMLPAQEQVWLLEALAGRRDDAARTAVEAGLFSTNAPVRQAAVQALAASSDSAAVPPLSKALARSPSPGERMLIERALMGLPHNTEVDSALIGELGDASAAVQASLVRVLSRREVRAAVPAIQRATDQPATAAGAFEALGNLATADDVPVLLGKLVGLKVAEARSDAEHAVAQALLKIDDPDRRAAAVVPALHAAADVETRCSLLRSLPVCAAPAALAAVNTARNDPNSQVRDTAVRALTEWPDARAWDALVEVLRRAENEAHRVLALGALVRLAEEGNGRPDRELLDRYRSLLESARTDDDRKRILGALAGVADPAALKLVLPLVKDAGIQAEAELAARQIAESIKEQHPKAAADALRQLK